MILWKVSVPPASSNYKELEFCLRLLSMTVPVGQTLLMVFASGDLE